MASRKLVQLVHPSRLFLEQLKKLESKNIFIDMEHIAEALSENSGSPLGGGFIKARVARPGSGKSSGLRLFGEELGPGVIRPLALVPRKEDPDLTVSQLKDIASK